MFTELSPLLKKGDTLVITVSRVDADKLALTVTPKLFTMDGERGPDRLQLNQPLALTGTAVELDSPEFAATLNRFTTSTAGLRQTIEDVEAAHKLARETKLKSPVKPWNKPAAPAAAKVETEVDDSDGETDNPEPKPAKPQEVTASLI